MRTRLRLGAPSASVRALPDVPIIGAQRGGTSSLYKYLGRHPDVVSSLRKETEYFSRNYSRGEAWYRAHFPLKVRRQLHRLTSGRPPVAFEATPDYLLDPRAAARAARLIPEAKLIVLLRDPVARAFSHHQHMTRLGLETLPFQMAIAQEEARIGEARERIIADESFVSAEFLHYSYLERGRYAEQLQPWFDSFGRDRILVIKSEDFYVDPASSLDAILEFIGLAPWRPATFANYSYSLAEGRPTQLDMDASTRSVLEAHFAQPNAMLYTLLGRDMGWH